MRAGKQSNLLGQLLVQAGIITEEQLETALKYQKRVEGKRGLLGRVLVSLNYCTEEDIARVLAKKMGVPYVSLENYPVDSSAAALIPPEIARRYMALPIGFDNDKLLVAMMQPGDLIALDDLRIITGYDIQPVVCPDSELEAAIERYASTGAEIRQESEDQVPEEEFEIAALDASTLRPAVQLANQIFNQAVRAEASDIHIEPLEKGMRVRFRIDGVLHDVMHPDRKIHPALVSRIKVMAGMDIAERRIPQDGRITLRVEGKTIDVRVASLPTAYGEKLTLRLLDRSAKLITLEQLGFPPSELQKYRELTRLPYGFILVTGPTGSGKSTTLYATLAALNTVDKHIVTVEDPIEYRLDGVNQMQVNPRAGLTFATGLRAILRNDPDIIMIGEIRDQETARIAVESALTGHLVFATLHTNDAAGAITRLAEMGIEPFLIASSLVGVLAQRLARVLCPNCKQAYEIERDRLLAMIPDFPVEGGENSIKLYSPRGCLRCNNTGYRGRIGIFELLLVNEEIRRLATSQASSAEIKRAAVEAGMITLRKDGLLKAKEGITSVEEVLRVVV